MTSLRGRFTFYLALLLVACVSLAVFLSLTLKSWPLVLPLVVLATFAGLLVLVRSFFAPLDATLQALSSGVTSFRDHDYSVTIASRRDDELGALVESYNALARVLREERFGLFQRELLLDTVIQSSAVAVLIVNANGAIVFCNTEARELLDPGKKHSPLGENLVALSARRSATLSGALEAGKDGLFSLAEWEEPEVFHLTCRHFSLNAQVHQLFLLKKMTREIARKEVETWKKVIRVITHEMNNSLAPIRSLISSAQKISASGVGTEKLEEIYASIGNRAAHLQSFIEQYAQFARLPKPRVRKVEWAPFISQLRRLVEFELAEDLPGETAEFDPVQVEQVLINLIKNAAESGSPSADINLRVMQSSAELLLAVEDRGSGMNPEQMQLALLPFYSTKRSGTGLGLPLCREIIEAHGGTLNLFNRQDGGMAATCKIPLGSSAGSA